jgi:hypothetical protein
VQFTDNNAGVNWAQFDVSKTCDECDFQPFGFDPEVSEFTEGEFDFFIWCTTDEGYSWTMRLTLKDVDGHVSDPVDFSIKCEPPPIDSPIDGPIARSFNTKLKTKEKNTGGSGP